MKKQTLIALIIAVVVIVILVALFAGRDGKPAEVQPVVTSEITAEPVPAMTAAPTSNPNITIDAAHGLFLQFPAKYADILAHEQEIHGELTTEVFSMRNGETDISLFRMDFGDETAGDWFGVLNTDDRIIPVTYTVFAPAEEELNAMSEATQEQYFALMDCFNDALNTIAADPRFTSERPLAVGADTEVKTTYWNLTLPSNMSVVETNENGTYIAMFYGEVVGERTALYTVRIGDDKAETELGLFEVDGVKKPVSVGSFDLSGKPNWTDDDYSAAYRMMDTINHVIETIMSSEQFSVPTVEE